MPNHYNYRFAGDRPHPAHRLGDMQKSFRRREEHRHHNRREHFPWWVLPFLIDPKEGKEYTCFTSKAEHF